MNVETVAIVSVYIMEVIGLDALRSANDVSRLSLACGSSICDIIVRRDSSSSAARAAAS